MNASPTPVDQILQRIDLALDGTLDPEVQEELAQVLSMLSRLEERTDSIHVRMLALATSALLKEGPEIELARHVRLEVAERLSLVQTPLHLLRRILVGRNANPAARVIFGLLAIVYLVIPLLMLWGPALFEADTILGLSTNVVLLVAIAGAVGSSVSIMVRIDEFSSLADVDPTVLFFTGLFKPIIGVAFALFLYAVISAGLIPVSVEQGKETFFFMALGFLSGFSERLAKDVADKTETVLLAPVPGAAVPPPG